MTENISAFALSDRGKERVNNQDACGVFCHGSMLLMVVADGVGGQVCGEVASHLTVATFRENLEKGPIEVPDAFLAEGARKANRVVREYMTDHPECKGMATTLTVVLIQFPELYVLHVGDSRGYLLRRGVLTRLTEDQTLVRKMVREGILSPEAAVNHPKRHIILNAVGPIGTLRFDYGKVFLERGDRVLLCSDGLYDEVSDGAIRDILSGKDARSVTGFLVQAANQAGGRDNISVAVAFIDEKIHGKDTVKLAARARFNETRRKKTVA
jgi:protein phosphatase